ncbi:SDR family NAD(P)-dependent oxidoreductase [Protaetiibacter mangrovi]|uniref:SDR family NAD(P)-dependent oxidoreductase n=1 Tax=Protaetiibacter mangrovi TaxID=2970926 RepID=A0ABT1ZGG0_9MICO|nr:SDR family NAD(P)-dependent oxidoreductase [Protaetiibacter mangrovi]MCS0499788.1 SDR family NAD(P)-dependent oxidoreductase [Protaetiibacter mangrovi]TPX04216.1 SDR family NAD(P)-dependent oxidoreductase [Schumannella luteola]
MAKDKPLTGKSSVGEWLKHPVGGPLLRDLLAQGGQDEKALAPVRLFPLQRLVQLSKGQFPQAMVDEMVAKVNGGVAPVEEEADDAPTPGEWTEQITPGRFAGKTVVVTGAGSGIGKATASRVAREGGKVIAVDVSQPRLDEFASELAGNDVTIVAGDITNPDSIAAIVAAAGGRIDALANVAGIMDDMTPLHEVSDAVWDRVISINVTGMFKLTRAVLPLMLEAGKGAIVNVASEAALRGSAAGLAYTTSKHAVVGLTKSTAFMYAGRNIRVNAVAPGGTATNIEASFASELGAERITPLLALLPPVAMPDQLAASITWLLSDDATNVTGQVVASDGGWSVQ